MIDLDSLDLIKPSEQGFEFEYISDATGKPTGVMITVLGENSEKVQSWMRKSLNRIRQFQALQTKRGKDDLRTVEEDEEFGIESAAIRITGWSGITQEYSHENALKLCRINPEILRQVVKHSNELTNFMPSK